jgi:hypothetical protein
MCEVCCSGPGMQESPSGLLLPFVSEMTNLKQKVSFLGWA